MEKLQNIKLLSATVSVNYLGVDSEGNTVSKTESATPDPAWTALLLRYLLDHQTNGVRSQSARSISLQGAFGEFPAVDSRRWHPEQTFNG